MSLSKNGFKPKNKDEILNIQYHFKGYDFEKVSATPYVAMRTDKEKATYPVLVCPVRYCNDELNEWASSFPTGYPHADKEKTENAVSFVNALTAYNELNLIRLLPHDHAMRQKEEELSAVLAESGQFLDESNEAAPAKALFYMDKSQTQMGAIDTVKRNTLSRSAGYEVTNITLAYRPEYRVRNDKTFGREYTQGASAFAAVNQQEDEQRSLEADRFHAVWEAYTQVNNALVERTAVNVNAVELLLENRFDATQLLDKQDQKATQALALGLSQR